MSIRDLFLEKTNSILSKDPQELRQNGESLGNIGETSKNQNRFIPKIDFSDPANFVSYGSAESYYQDSIARIYDNYPYDGSSKEKQEFLGESSYIDLWMLDNKYPRTNGYIIMSADGWGTATTSPVSSSGYYGEPSTQEYINIFGGPHTASEGMIGKTLNSTFDKSNIYDTDIYENAGYSGAGSREGNLKTDFDNGVTVEFWLKKELFDISKTQKEVIFDMWNGQASSSVSRGRLRVELSSSATGYSPFNIFVESGSANFSGQFGSSLSVSSLSTFGHYAFRIYNDTNLSIDMYKNGELIESQTAGSSFSEIVGAMEANIGSLVQSASVGGGIASAGKGWGKLSGSLDEFRFWKTKRTSEQIGRHWFSQVYGGTNTDISNTSLGVYYKFNEGITGYTSLDSTVLDYSGRVTNGNWVGYTTNSRNTGSAMIIASASLSEFRDPIIYSEHPSVQSVLTEMKLSGSSYDVKNMSSMYGMMPNWVIEDDNDGSGELKKLTQVMSSYLDTLQMQIRELPKIQNVEFYSGSYSKEYPFMAEILEGRGMVAPDIFADASVLEQVFDRSQTELYSENLSEVKNLIYRNIYNNLVYIYKSKGTEKSFRNLIRCYGIDDSLISLNLYANNLTYKLEDTLKFDSEKKRYVDFYKSGFQDATVYQQTSSAIANSISYISASGDSQEKYTSFTLEADVILPKKKLESDPDYFATNFATASVFGFHTADISTPAEFTWPATDFDLKVYVVAPTENNNKKDAYFVLTSSYLGINLTSSMYGDVYDNTRWNISARFYPEKRSNLVSGSSNTNYIINFTGIEKELDVTKNTFTLTSSISNSGYLTEPKRIYAGAHRQNFTGSSLQSSDIRLGFVRYWMSKLEDGELSSHAEDPTNHGTEHPLWGTYLDDKSLENVEVPRLETLAMDWGWDIISSSSAAGTYELLDKSSGSASDLDRYSWVSNVTQRQHTAVSDNNLPSTRAVNVEYIPVARSATPESLNPSLTSIKILNEFEQETLDRNTRPTNFYYMLEKSMYATISKEILRYFSTIVDFNNLIGEPVNRYRPDYKDISKLRQLFFENVENEPSVEKFIDYYKWIDSALSEMLLQLVPASSDVSDGIKTIIESHVLERNKYRNKLPTMGEINTDISGGLYGVERSSYAWKTGTPTLPSSPPPTNEHCYWWRYRADRTNPRITSGVPAVDATRNAVLSVVQTQINRNYFSPVRVVMSKDDIYTSGINSSNNNITDYVKNAIKFGSDQGLFIEASKIKGFIDCLDVIDPMEKKKWSYAAQNENSTSDYATSEGDLVAPFVAVSSSVKAGYNSLINSSFKDGFGIENMHIDAYVGGETPLQGPFTEKYVGGKQSRHVALNTGADNVSTRPEAWEITLDSTQKQMKIIYQPVDRPRAALFRGLTAKMPLNITNIKTTTSDVGNYSKEYEIVQTTGRYTNNSAYVKAGGWDIVEIASPYVAGMMDYEKPQRGKTPHVFVNRFSSPGAPDTAGDSNGGPALDTYSAEFSPYNNINYRNTTTRNIYKLLLASHVNQFGLYSNTFNQGPRASHVNSLNYDGTGSIYQTNRNPIRQLKQSGSTTLTSSVYDNFYVRHPIPRSDLQYAWITASYMSYDTFGYLPYSGEVSSSAGEISLVTFSSASDYVSKDKTGAHGYVKRFGEDKSTLNPFNEVVFLPTVYNGLNYNVYEPSSRDTGILGYELQSDILVDMVSYRNSGLLSNTFTNDGKAAILNALLLKRNGPYQHPTWKQIRNYDNPIVKNRRQNGLTAYNIKNVKQQPAIATISRFTPTKILKDPAVISKFSPIEFSVNTATDSEDGKMVKLESVVAEATYGNELTRFANNEITYDVLGTSQSDTQTPYRAIYDMYSGGKIRESSSPIDRLNYVLYSEQIYPSSINCYSKTNRERVGYKNTFWKNARSDRTVLGQSKFGGNNSQGFATTQSAWSLDTCAQFGKSLEISSYVAHNYAVGAAGELQNDYTFWWATGSADTFGSASYLRPSPILSRKQSFNPKYSVVTPTGMESIVLAATSSDYLMAHENLSTLGSYNLPYGLVMARGGNANFEAHTLAGYINDKQFISSSATPFYDKYEQYNLEMRLKNKDMSIVPEFRISRHIEKYLADSNGFVSQNNDMFSIFGVNEQGDQSISYNGVPTGTGEYTVKVGLSAPSSSAQTDFYKVYSFSDFMQHFDIINDDHEQFGLDKRLTLSCKALMKFIPYDGFYPAEHTLDIANAFSQSYSDYISFSSSSAGSYINGSPTDPLKNRPIYETLFSPGILFNTIKSGIAVDYPVYTGSYDLVLYTSNSANTTYIGLGTGSQGAAGWDHRVDFETLLEPERLNDISIMDMNPGVYERLTLITAYSSASLSAPVGDNTYKMMVNNFLAEVPRFFLEDGLTKLVSGEKDKIAADAGSTYGMRLKMYRSMNRDRAQSHRYNLPQDPINDTGLHETMTMYSRPTAFGPPVVGSNAITSGSLQADSTCGINPSFTPPYYNGECWVDITYTAPSILTASLTIEDIISGCSTNLLRSIGPTQAWDWPMNSGSATSAGVTYPYEDADTANNFSMQLPASVNLFLKDSQGKWNIQTKFETPMLNFGDKTVRPLDFDTITMPSTGTSGGEVDFASGYGGQTSTPIGMWHQFGLIPNENEGIYLSLQDIDPEFLKYGQEYAPSAASNTKSLIDLVGFRREEKKLGKIRDNKKVWEAIVAVPFIETADCTKSFFLLSSEDSEDTDSLRDKMEKYVFPPQFDFVRNINSDPMAMYVFEFDHTFDRDDLSYIWQNISPKFGSSYKTATSSITHPLLAGNMLESLSGQVKWMVFKVKQRASSNYYDNVAGSPKGSSAKPYAFNWPYDYFSMVEFAKIDSQIEFGGKQGGIQVSPTSSGEYTRKPLIKDISQVSSMTQQDILDIEKNSEASVESAKALERDRIVDRAFDHQDTDTRAFDHQDTDTRAFDHQDKE